MHPFFQIAPDLIQRLDDKQARKLIALLCEADIARADIAPCVYYGGDQRAADDGVDVEVAGRPAKDLNERLKRSVAAVQVKAEKKPFSAAKIAKEMAPNEGPLRPAIAALASDRGFYLIAATKEQLSYKTRAARLKAMRDLLAESGMENDIAFDFFGSQEIASWVESHPPIGAWLRQELGASHSGWQAYGPWAYRETNVDKEFVLDKSGRVSIPGNTELVPVADAISGLRRDLRAGRAVRLVGLSGLGKTRLAQALFDERIEVHEPALAASSVLYADIGDRPRPTPEDVLAALPSTTGETILIVDNCGQETHNALVARHEASSAHIGLLTIEYNIQDGVAVGTRAYKLDGASDETLDKLLQARFKKVNWRDREVIIAASQGNARLAYAIADTAEHTGQLALLEDGELFRRLFNQREETGDELLRCARAASLVYSFDVSDTGPGSELFILAKLAEVTPETLYRHMAEVQRRGLLQSRGKMRAILPHAVSNHMAASALEEIPTHSVVAALYTNAPSRLGASFTNRLSYLSASPVAVEIAERLITSGGPLSDIAKMDTDQLTQFERLTPLKPDRAISAIENFVESGTLGDRTPDDLRKISQIVRSIAHDATLFTRSVSVLVKTWKLYETLDDKRFGGKEHEIKSSITSLFQVAYSGTHATALERAQIVRQLLNSTDEAEQRLGVECLDSTLRTQSLSTSDLHRFGTQSRDFGWAPKSIEEQEEWFALFLSLAGELVEKDDASGTSVKTVLGTRSRDLLHTTDGTINALVKLAPKLQTEDGWPEAWSIAKLLLRRKGIDVDFRNRIQNFEKAIAPRGLRQRVAAKLHSREIFDDDDYAIEEYGARSKEAENEAIGIGRELGRDLDLIIELLPKLTSTGNKGLPFSLGEGVAETVSDVWSTLLKIGKWLENIDDGSVSTLFVRGMMSQWAKQSPKDANAFLDFSVRDERWKTWFAELQLVVTLDDVGLKRVISAVEYGAAPIEGFQWLRMGRTLGPHSIDLISTLLDRIADKGVEGVHVALEILHSQVYSAKNRPPAEQAALGGCCLKFLLDHRWTELDLEQTMIEHNLDYVFGMAVQHAASFEQLKPLLDRSIDVRRSPSRYRYKGRGHLVSTIVSAHPDESLTYLLNHPSFKSVDDLAKLLLIESPNDMSGHGRRLLNADHLLKWVEGNPEARIDLAVRICRIESSAEDTFVSLYESSTNRIAFIQAFGARLIRGYYSSSDVPHLQAGLGFLDALPATSSADEIQARELVKQSLTERVGMFSDWARRDEEYEPEGFE